jgi:alanine dehydrogenase
MESRVGLTPENAREYVAKGHTVLIERGAGEGSTFQDGDYLSYGAKIVDTAQEVWERAEMIVKVKEPLPEEYPLLRENQILYTYLHLAADRTLTEQLLKAKVKAVAYETVRDAKGGLPLLKPMSEVAGRLSIQEGAKCLEKPMGGMGLLLAGVPGVRRANVVILGGGVVGMNACKIAVGIGASVTIFDNNLDRLAYLDDIFHQSIQTQYSTDAAIENALRSADLVIGAVLIPGGATPKLVKRRYLSSMKPGSVIVDVAVDQGGCCETTRPTYHDNPTFVVDGVLHYCVGNMPGAVALTSTMALTNSTLSRGLAMATFGLEAAVEKDPLLATGVNCYQGKLTCQAVAEAFGMEYQPWQS